MENSFGAPYVLQGVFHPLLKGWNIPPGKLGKTGWKPKGGHNSQKRVQEGRAPGAAYHQRDKGGVMTAWSDLLALFGLPGRWQRLMPDLFLPSNASLKDARFVVAALKQALKEEQERAQDFGFDLELARAALQDCQGRLLQGPGRGGWL